MAITNITGVGFCDKNTWYSGNNGQYGPDKIVDGVPSSRWIGAQVDATLSLQNFGGIRFDLNADVTQVQIMFASWGRNFSIGTWAAGANPNSATFTKADIIPIRAIDVTNNPLDDVGVSIAVGQWLTFNITRANCPGLIFYCDNNANNVMSNTAGAANTNQSIYEAKVSGTWLGNPPTKQIGTAICSSQYNDFGTVASVNDGNTATGWSGGNAGGNAVLDWVGLQFGVPVKVQKLDVFIYSWGKTIAVGYANSVPATKADFTVVRTIDITQTPLDDIGVPWARNTKNTILLPSNNAFASIWGVWTNDTAANPLGVGGGGVDRVRMMELNMYSDGQAAPLPDPAGPNPKPPTGSPVVPFSTTPTGWTRTEIAVNGSGTFTPDPYTTLIAVGLQGAGAGGRVNVSLTGQTTPNNSTLNGGDTFISNASGVIARAPGGIGSAIPFAPKFASDIGTPCDWLRALDNNGRAGSTTAAGSNAGTAGGASFVSGVAGTAITLAAQDTNGPVTATTTFTGTAALPFTPTYVNASRVSGTGLTTNIALATAGTPTQTASIEFSFKAYAGQIVTLNFVHLIPNAQTTGTYRLNSDAPVPLGISSGTAVSPSFPIAVDGTQTIRFDLSTTATTGTIPLFRVTSMQLAGVGQAGGSSGASGRAATFFFLPNGPFTYTVGKGGIGQTGGQTVTAATHGTRGSGGGTGGNGGDGVLVIYEYKSALPLDKAPTPVLATYNQPLTTEVLAAYRSNYLGQASTNVALGWKTQTAFTHKLRPRTKNVFVLMTGPGGQWRSSSAILDPDQSLPTVVTSGALTFTAESGWTGRTFGGSTGYGGDGGVFQDAPNILFSARGNDGYGTGQSQANPSIFASAHGSGGSSSYLNISGGGCGGYGLVIIPSSAFNEDRTISGFIGNTGTSAGAGAVFIYETEAENSPFTTQLVEQILRKEGVATTQTTQATEMLLRKDGLAVTQTTQATEMILTKEDDSANPMQVSYATIAFIVDAEDPITNITQTPELVFAKQPRSVTQNTQSPQLILAKQPFSVYRATQTAELIFLSEIPSIFWLNFGTIDGPNKNQIYTSLTGRATSVKPGSYIQLESPHAPGTTMFINDVDVGLSGSVTNNDRVYIKGGIPNWWQTSINVYTYYITNGEVTRELVGTWLFKHPIRTPTISRAYAALALQTNWLKLTANFATFVVMPFYTKTLNAVNAQLSSVFTKAQAASFSVIDTLFAPALSSIATVTTTWEIAKAFAKYERGMDSEFTSANYGTVDYAGYDFAQNNVQSAASPLTVEKADAITHLNNLFDFEITLISSHEEDRFENEYSAPVMEFYTNAEFEKASVNDSHYDIGMVLSAEVGFGQVKVTHEKWNVDHSETANATYLPIMYTHYFGIFDVTPIVTKAYSVLSGVAYEKSEVNGIGWYLMPLGNAYVHKTGFGTFETGTLPTIAYSTPFETGTDKSGASELGYFNTESVFMQSGSSAAGYDWLRTIPAIGKVELNVVFTSNKMEKVDFIPYRYAQSENGRGKASLYMGFDTTIEATEFTQNFSDVKISPQYNGFIYTVGVDKTFVCEIYFNGPVSGLIQGG